MVDTDFCLQVSGQPFGHLPGDPVLSERGLDKDINPYYQEEQDEDKPLQYFFETFQARDLDVKVCNRIL